MSWHPFKNRVEATPSVDAQRANDTADTQLEAARKMRVEAHEVSLQLQVSHSQNHFAASFAEAMSKGTGR
jgi:hypothetical protein